MVQSMKLANQKPAYVMILSTLPSIIPMVLMSVVASVRYKFEFEIILPF